MKNLSQSKTTNQREESLRISKALFEKIMANSEEIGKMKTEPFNIVTVERCRAMYKENESLFNKLVKSIEGE